MNIYKELSRLNPRQKEAVMHTEGPLLILAGAGTGKTRVITMRTAYLINSGVRGDSILAVTFTNKAAREMRERVSRMIKKGNGIPFISTFHSLCLRILRREIEALGYRKDFTIYDTSEQVSLLRTIMSDIKFYDRTFKPELVLERISMTKNEFGLERDDENEDPLEEASSLLYPRYLQALKSMNALDFDDLLLLTLKLFRDHPGVLEKYREQFRYIMVDEYQDTNRVQYNFIKLLAGERKNICVVGDDDQSIYGWRGADITNILDFEKDFTGTVTVRLEQNYRSFGNILRAANSVIKNNKRRMEKTLRTDRDGGPKVNIFRAGGTEDEADWVANRISMLMDQKKIAADSIAIIYRANLLSRPFLKIIANPSDDLSLMRAVSAPKRGLGPSTLGAIADYARSNSISMFDAFGRASDNDRLKPAAAGSAESFHQLVCRYRTLFDSRKHMANALKALMDEIDFRDYIITLYKTPEAAYRRIENLDGFIESMKHYESVGDGPSLPGFLETMALTDLVEEKEEQGGFGVTLISFHSSKGLEFPVVFIAAAEEDIIPHKKSAAAHDGLEEERRLFYVGITRAMKELFITYTGHRVKYGKETPSVPSRFLEEIPEDVSQLLDRFEESDPEKDKAYVKSLYEEFMGKFK
ncbi:MAG: hypothetical protein AMK71_12000 [Nitrospira bacterium SG8_35_4]|nr:MAG: hypothetical protein AMK71_12000 [Nitrospira bacterium SG8_35_4]